MKNIIVVCKETISSGRYAEFTRGHSITFHHILPVDTAIFDRDFYKNRGFKPEDFKLGIPEEFPEADLYFIEDIGKDTIKTLSRLPLEKTVLVANKRDLLSKAHQLGYQKTRTFGFGIQDFVRSGVYKIPQQLDLVLK
jgi:hypothetical protein